MNNEDFGGVFKIKTLTEIRSVYKTWNHKIKINNYFIIKVVESFINIKQKLF